MLKIGRRDKDARELINNVLSIIRSGSTVWWKKIQKQTYYARRLAYAFD